MVSSVVPTSGRADERTCRLAVSSSAALGAVDVIYVLKNRISPVYLLDAVVELKLIGLWGLARLSGRRATRAEAGSPRIVGTAHCFGSLPQAAQRRTNRRKRCPR